MTKTIIIHPPDEYFVIDILKYFSFSLFPFHYISAYKIKGYILIH